MNRSAFIGSLGFLLGVWSLSFNVGREIHIPVGGARGPLMMSGLGPSEAALALPAEEVKDSRHDFYFRKIESGESRLSIPLRPRGAFDLAVRMDSTVRTRLDVFGGGTLRGGSFAPTGPWTETAIATGVDRGPLDLTLRFQDAPLVRRSDTESFRRYIDEIVIRSDQGFDLPWSSRIAGGFVLLLLVALLLLALPSKSSVSSGLGVLGAVLGSAILFWVSLIEPVGLSLALPRLLGFVLACVILISLIGFVLGQARRAFAVLALLGSAMVLVYGGLSFLPNHSPADLDIHIWRTLDLSDVPMSYDAWLRYGSHYPTPSQIRGSATEALGEGPAIPYSPLPYLLFHAAHAVGLDLHWSMNALEATCLALLLPLIFTFARGASSEAGGFLAAALMSLDLATIHHLGRAHAPAVVGGALGLVGLLALGLALPRLSEPGRWRIPALFLGLGALGYSSTPLFYALFGISILSLVLSRGESQHLLRPLVLTLGTGGVIALVLFYGHYIPGLLSARESTALMSDPFPGRTYFIFHNESRQSLRLWRLGLFVPFLAALPATYLVVRRGPETARSFLLAWCLAWAGIMLLKEPWALPVLLRWAKEDFYVTPALALMVAIAIARLPSRPLRLGLAGLTVIVSIFLRARDLGFHADTLRFLK